MDERDYSGDGYLTKLEDWPAGSTEARCIADGDQVFLRGPKRDFGDGVMRHPVYIKPKNYKPSKFYTPRPQPEVATIYFIGPDGGPIKIGYASRLKFRLRDLQNANAYPLIVHATIDGAISLENEYHRRFAAHRLHGEWFEPHPDILAEIDRLNAQVSA